MYSYKYQVYTIISPFTYTFLLHATWLYVGWYKEWNTRIPLPVRTRRKGR